ncbi:WD repeat protein Lub1 [Coemansia sp. RSA 2711]|nr:WD repeat protein Lub1 [Coemansia sp. RSA 2711]
MGMAYRLSAELAAHTDDVRGIAAQGSDMVVTVSRDGTGRIWRRADGGGFAEDSVLAGHTGFVSSVAVLPATDEHPEGLVATGGMDATICVWDPRRTGEPVARLRGHQQNVCALAAGSDGRTLVSGSWDKTARVWDVGGQCTHTLAGHAQAVWGVLLLDARTVVTASADKLVRCWQDGRLTQTLEGHTDCVRALAAVDASRVASAANDGTVRVWDVGAGTCTRVLRGHTSLVYAVAGSAGVLASGGEDRTVRVWRDAREEAHTIVVPATSVWSVCVLANGDVACGTSDGRARVFTRDAARLAPEPQRALLAQQNASFAMSAQAMGHVDLAGLPGPERLAERADRDEQVVMVREGARVLAYQWTDGAWARVGEVSDAAASTQKREFEGKMYDYVFDVDIREGAPPLKLPFDATDNPYAAAQRFLERHALSLEHLDTVADFIVKNSGGVALGAAQQPAAGDPFTGGSRYVPAQQPAQQPSSADPFTGASRYTPAAAAYSPPAEYVVGRQGNGRAIVAKLVEFNALLGPGAAALSSDDIGHVRELETLGSGSPPPAVSAAACAALLRAALGWPADRRFPALDLLRLALAASPSHVLAARVDGRDLVACVAEAAGLYTVFAQPMTRADEINAMMGVRALANAFADAAGVDMVWAARKPLLDALDGSWAVAINKSLVVALSNLYLNLAIAATAKNDDDQALGILSAASRFLDHTDNADAQLRLVNVFGVLAAKFQLCRDSARVLGDETIVILGIQGQTEAVKKAAKDVGAFLSA